MDARHLELLRELADHGSVTAVARATHRTPSAVSQQLKSAERRYQTPLVEPSGRGLRLTDAGHLLADAGRDVAEALARAQARWDEFRGQPTGRVRVAALPSAATFLLPGVFTELAELAIEIECEDVDLAEDDYPGLTRDHDLVIGHSLSRLLPPSVAGQVSALLTREPLDIAMAASHPLATQEQVSAQDLADQQWIGVPFGYPFDTVRVAVEEAIGCPVQVSLRLRDNRLIEALVASSDRVAVLPRFTTPTGPVVLRPLAEIPTARFIYAVARPDRAERLAVRRVLDALRRVGATFAGSG
ncbi:LysR family transcriptional regulator [Nocardioides limicola]|uniref:LysR family transcriptional regulator n=1 Tax=Nocardioides limicola TaxID=2803368 RepID=UPI00193C5849|nr:LysR family transcriptional regulator [Nocardioides sp. DJM-14]